MCGFHCEGNGGLEHKHSVLNRGVTYSDSGLERPTQVAIMGKFCRGTKVEVRQQSKGRCREDGRVMACFRVAAEEVGRCNEILDVF